MSELMKSLAAEELAAMAALDIIEVFSPSRLNQEVQRFGFRPGAAIDLDELKPDGSERWDLDKEEDFELAMEMIIMEHPWLVTSSPPCTTFSPLRRISNGKRGPKVVAEEEELGRARLRKSVECCETQASLGGYFLHEHPRDSTSWEEEEEEEVKQMLKGPNVQVVQSPMCRSGMKARDDRGELLYVRKETLWATNSPEMARELKGVCENQLKGKEVHRHVHLIGCGRAKAALWWKPYFEVFNLSWTTRSMPWRNSFQDLRLMTWWSLMPRWSSSQMILRGHSWTPNW